MISPAARNIAATAVVLAAGVVGASQAGASTTGLRASWQMNEKSGPVVDSSSHRNNGTVHGGVTRTGKGYRFDGESGYVTVPNDASLNPGADALTITVAFTLDRKPASGKDYDLVRKGLAATPGGNYKIEVLSNGQALCRFHGAAAAGVVQGGSNLGTGSHVVRCVKTDTAVSLVVDGVRKASRQLKVGSISNSQPVILAAKPGDDFTKGLINYITIA